MKANNVIREVMKRRNMTVNAMVEILGIKQPTMSQRLKQNNLSTDKMIEMLNVMGYRLVAIPETTVLQEEAIEITM